MRNPLISVCMLCYNHEKYVAQSIQSLLDQTYENWELIVVDNASTDNSSLVIRDCVLKDKRIKFFPLDINTFISHGVNYGLKKTTGEYIALISADDYFESNKIEHQLRFMQNNKVDVCFTWIKAVDDNQQELLNHAAVAWTNKSYMNSTELCRNIIVHGNLLAGPTVMMKKKILDDVGYFDNRLLQTQDFELWLRVIKKHPIVVLEERLTCYRVRDDGGNISINSNKQTVLRSNIEHLFCMQHICDLDADVIGQAINQSCDNVSKYKRLFDFYIQRNNKISATAVLLALYQKIGNDFEFPSLLYQDFFDSYSNLDVFDQFYVNGVYASLDVVDFTGEVKTLRQYVKFDNKYNFDVHFCDKISKIIFTPINQPSMVRVLNACMIRGGGVEVKLECKHDSIQLVKDTAFDFKGKIPQFVFDIKNDFQDGVIQFCFEVDISVYNKFEICNLLSESQNELEGVKNELESVKNELSNIYNSKSWYVTKPIRVINKIIKRIIHNLSNRK